jgi:hypothetical protein
MNILKHNHFQFERSHNYFRQSFIHQNNLFTSRHNFHSYSSVAFMFIFISSYQIKLLLYTSFCSHDSKSWKKYNASVIVTAWTIILSDIWNLHQYIMNSFCNSWWVKTSVLFIRKMCVRMLLLVGCPCTKKK